MRIAVFILMLLAVPFNLTAQQCSKATAALVSEQSENKFNCNGPFGGAGIGQVIITDNYSLSCVNTNDGTEYFKDASTITGHGECSICTASNGCLNNRRCDPEMKMIINPATDASGAGATGNNQFFNNATDHFLCDGIRCLGSTTGCGTGNQFQDFHQCTGIACTVGPPPPPGPCINPPKPGSGFKTTQTGDPTDDTGCSPIIIDLAGNGFELTDAAHGVVFDIAATGIPMRIAWTANANNAFLVLDRDGSGTITSGAELFGNFTSQPSSPHPNGFAALAVYDGPMNGGNGDGIIDARDQIFSKLRLWVDANHDGICQPGELHLLPDLGVFSISLNYSLSRRTDEFGNIFRYKARINQGQHGEADVGKKAYDVFFVSQ